MTPARHRSRFRRFLDWMFRSRDRGRITIAQWPNAALWIFLAATLVGVVAPLGAVRVIAGVVATAAIAWWAVDEVARGVNPFRRMLGGTVIAAVILGALN